MGKKTTPSTTADIPTVAAELRASFMAGYTRPLATRIAQLKVGGLSGIVIFIIYYLRSSGPPSEARLVFSVFSCHSYQWSTLNPYHDLS